jgi:hypothetical protein
MLRPSGRQHGPPMHDGPPTSTASEIANESARGVLRIIAVVIALGTFVLAPLVIDASAGKNGWLVLGVFIVTAALQIGVIVMAIQWIKRLWRVRSILLVTIITLGVIGLLLGLCSVVGNGIAGKS